MSQATTVTRPHELAASTTLRTDAMHGYDLLRDAVAQAANAVKQLRQDQDRDDIVVVMANVNLLSLAAEALAQAAEELHKTADAALVKAMEETGCTSIYSANLNVSLAQSAGSVDVTDRSAVPPELWRTPEPSPDAVKIRAWLKKHPETNWARLLPGKPHLRRSAA